MARRNKAEMLQKQKEAKQKKLLIVLAPIFLALVVWQGPKMLKAFQGTEAPPPPAATTPADPAAPTAAAPAAGTPPPPQPAGLVDTDVPSAAGPDRLVSFSRFDGRDPFGAPGGGAAPEAGAPAPDGDDDEALTSAVLEVNGTSETVAVDGEFPAGDPTFRLVSVAAGRAVIGLVSGSFERGEETVELAVGEELELVADPDGTRYTVTLVSVG